MLVVQNHSEVNAIEWNTFMVHHSSTPYPQTTIHAEYVQQCYSALPLYITIQSERAELRCLIFINKKRGTVTWYCGPVIKGTSVVISILVDRFLRWITQFGFPIRNASCIEMTSLQAILTSNEILNHAGQYNITSTLATLIKIRLDCNIWEQAIYRTGGKKRKIKNLVLKSVRDGVEVSSSSEFLPQEESVLYMEKYKALMERGFQRNAITQQDASGACKILLSQDKKGDSKTFFAFKGKDVLACLNFAIIGSEAYLRKLVYDDRSYLSNSGVTYHAMMTAAEWAQSQKLKTLNLTSVRLSKDDKTRRMRQYKTRFGGTILPIYEFSSLKND
ncbi:hypothetical protein [Photorhabdus antumapuensis]|uniref:hypothetical protein n=1 Tax=Photorhabdus antumapuensis TaxID=2862867 RepID=UPI001CED2F10|nr:hypothetical protein [Photorhabdus antumapuensis]MCA6221530.1 hypothetical protein [Photorhabdus antumapuensis]